MQTNFTSLAKQSQIQYNLENLTFSRSSGDEMVFISGGLRVGKTRFTELKPRSSFVKHDTALVDDAYWTTISCNRDASNWIRIQNTKYWYEHKDQAVSFMGLFDLHEKLLTLMELTWS